MLAIKQCHTLTNIYNNVQINVLKVDIILMFKINNVLNAQIIVYNVIWTKKVKY